MVCANGRVGGQLMTDDVASSNRPGQRLLESIGFEKDNSVPDVCLMRMTRQACVGQLGEPNEPGARDGP